MRLLSFLCLMIFSIFSFANEREIAITIDDLPLVGSRMNTPENRQRATDRFMNIVRVLNEHQVPATGFVIAGAIDKGQWDFLEHFHNSGLVIGNHTYSHYNLNKMNAEKYIADVDKADQILAPLFTETKYFRYPYLAEGNSSNRRKVLQYLREHNYVIAPVTIDSKDFKFNEEIYKIPFRLREQFIMNQMKARYLGYIWKQTLKAEHQVDGMPSRQILLIHANLLNSYLLEDIIKMYKENGYKFITLAKALENPGKPIEVPMPQESENQEGLEGI